MAAGASSFGDMPQRGAAPPEQDSLVGPAEESQAKPSDQQAQNRNFTSGVKNLHKQLDDFARQYPDMSESCDKAKSALTKGMVSHMSNSAREGGGSMQPPPLAG
jgi:hypothetical protein